MIDMTNFKKSVKWYDENLATLLPQYRGKYVGVCIDKVCGSWDDRMAGLNGMVAAGYKPGEFIVHHCVPLEEEPCFQCHTDNIFRNPAPLRRFVHGFARIGAVVYLGFSPLERKI